MMPVNVCVSCGKPNDAATEVLGKRSPRAGDVSVCLYCGHIMVFKEDLRLREPTAQECHEIAGDKRILAIQRVRGKR